MVLICSHPYSCPLQEFHLSSFRLLMVDVTHTGNGKRKLWKLNEDINNAIFFMCAVESEGCLSLSDFVSSWWVRLLMLNRNCVKSLWSWRATKTCRSSEAVGLLHFSVICISVQVWHHFTEMGWSLLSPRFHRLWYLLLGGLGGHLHVKDKRDKNCRSERKNRGKETRWVVDRIIPVLAKGKRIFTSNQSSDLPQISWNIVIWIRITGFVFFVCFVVVTSITSQTCIALEML